MTDRQAVAMWIVIGLLLANDIRHEIIIARLREHIQAVCGVAVSTLDKIENVQSIIASGIEKLEKKAKEAVEKEENNESSDI